MKGPDEVFNSMDVRKMVFSAKLRRRNSIMSSVNIGSRTRVSIRHRSDLVQVGCVYVRVHSLGCESGDRL